MAHLRNVTQHHVLSPCSVYPCVALRQVGIDVFWGPRKAAIFAHCQRETVCEERERNVKKYFEVHTKRHQDVALRDKGTSGPLFIANEMIHTKNSQQSGINSAICSTRLTNLFVETERETSPPASWSPLASLGQEPVQAGSRSLSTACRFISYSSRRTRWNA